MKIVVLDGKVLNPGDLSWEGLEKLGDLKVYDRTPEDKIIERVGDAEIIFTNKTFLKREVLSKLINLKYIGVLATGYNVVDVEAAKDLGIVVTNIPAYSTDSVAQFVFALLLEICHNVGEHSKSVKKGEWANARDFSYWNHPLMELAGKKFGIIGYGSIGKATGELAKAFGMEVLAYNKGKNKGKVIDGVKHIDFDELLEKSDVISLHCPLFDSTRGMINKETIARMKDGVILINTARGPLIVEEDLARALNDEKVRAAGLDVLSKEPATKDNPLLKAKNTIITPHIAWAPKEARERLMNIAVKNLESFLDGEIVNSVI
ncbi:D-2-hydroxyacid dehydrogenase [Halonatronum saccharophilum]|uniref:D-2-hydroxyacid dehydrogenase n=1 Tax=Halonatronum saccharophilum TaxID=150060 RepID=UPI000488ABB0|nr:D-2-hydroxyacid dehydrogenase [Halonatronum saccharophilum]